MSSCRSCGAPLLWAETERGKLMPLDEQPNAAGTIVLRRQMDRKPLAIVGVSPEAMPGEPLYTSHFATCRDAADWRRDR